MPALLRFSKWFARVERIRTTLQRARRGKRNPFRPSAPFSVLSGRSSRVDLSGYVFFFRLRSSHLQPRAFPAARLSGPLCSLSPACLAGLRSAFVFPATSPARAAQARACLLPAYRPWSSAAHSFPLVATESVCPSLGSCCSLRSCLIVFPPPVKGRGAFSSCSSATDGTVLSGQQVFASRSEILGLHVIPGFAGLITPTDRLVAESAPSAPSEQLSV